MKKMNVMEEILKNIDGFLYEESNSFEKNSLPCYYFKKEMGFVVFFICKGGVLDYGVYDNRKDLIVLLTNIDQSINQNWRKQFVARSIKEVIPNKLKRYKQKI